MAKKKSSSQQPSASKERAGAKAPALPKPPLKTRVQAKKYLDSRLKSPDVDRHLVTEDGMIFTNVIAGQRWAKKAVVKFFIFKS